MGYHQLTEVERYQISALLTADKSLSEIAKILRRHKSTISRELERNTGLRGYRPKQAQKLSSSRKQSHIRQRISDQIWNEVERLITEDWSPEQIAWRLYEEQGVCISHEWIYQFVYKDKLSGGDLHTHLRCRQKRKKRYGKYDKRGKMKDRVGIEERPAIVELNSRPGDWEGDTVEGAKHQGYLLTLVERRAKFLIARPLLHKKAEATSAAMIEALDGHVVKTMTLDNGKEFSDHKEVTANIHAPMYFADPYSSWQRGLNENTNGLLRQYFPKGMDLRNIDPKQLEDAVNKLNNRPRKTLGWKTPNEMMYKKITSLTRRVALTS